METIMPPALLFRRYCDWSLFGRTTDFRCCIVGQRYLVGEPFGSERALASKIKIEKEASFRPVPRFDKCCHHPSLTCQQVY